MTRPLPRKMGVPLTFAAISGVVLSSCLQPDASVLETSGCSAEAPSEYYQRVEFVEDNSGGGLMMTALREFNPDQTARAYDQKDLECWSSRGDPISDYLLLAKIAGSANVLVLDDDVSRISRSRRSVAALRRAADARRCSNEFSSRELFCETGLPEAQYILALVILENDEDRARAAELLSKAASAGLFVASQKLETVAQEIR